MDGESMSKGETNTGEPPMKTRRGDGPAVELRFLIPSKAAGVIIGKGGENIKKVREEFSAKVNIPDSNGPERVLHLEGDLGSLVEILAETLPRVEDSTTSRGMDYMEGNIDIRILVHESQAGCIIGRSGYKIKELREQCTLKTLKVYQMRCPNSTDRVIQLVGDLAQVLACLQTIVTLLESAPPKGPRQDYDARHFDESQSASYGGFSSLPGGGAGHLAGQPLPTMSQGVSPMMNPGMMSGASPRTGGMLGGPRGDVPMVQGMIRAGMGVGNRPAMSMIGGHGGAQMASGFASQSGGDIISTQVSIPDNLIGSIMGKGGVRIKQIRAESGADIRINKSEPGMDDRIITITGTSDQIQNAQYLLQMCVKKYSGQY